MPTKPPRLGKGLSALVAPRSERLSAVPPGKTTDAVTHLPIDTIRPGKHQPRTGIDPQSLAELAESVRQAGVLQPILVRPIDDGHFELLAGERRWQAARQAGLETIPAIIKQASDREALEIGLIENIQREDLNPIERARAYQAYLEQFQVGPEALAQRLGESRSNIANYIRLLDLDAEILEMVERGQLAMGHARAIVGIPGHERQRAVARLAVRRNLSVRQVEDLAKQAAQSAKPARERPGPDPHIVDVERKLSQAVGLPVKIHSGRSRNSGRVVIRYRNLEEFDRIAECLQGRPVVE